MTQYSKHSRFKRSLVLGAAAFCLMTPQAFAQLSADQQRAATGQADAGRTQQNILGGEISPQMSSPVEVRDVAAQDVPPNADKIRFQLNGIELDGIGVYTEADIRPVYAHQLGTEISLADVYGIAAALTNKYRNDGYILTQVRVVIPQTIDGGIVKLRAYEGFVDQIIVEGTDQESALSTIRGYANRIREQGTLNVRELEKFLLIINDLPGVNARSILSPSKTRNAASDLRIIVERDPYDAFVGVDNFGSRYLGPIQFTAAASANSVFGNNERITAQFVTVPDNAELVFFSLAYKQPIGTYGTTIEALYSHANTEPGFDLDQFDVNGKSDFASIKVEHPFIRTRGENLYGHALFDFRDVQSRNDLEPTREDRIRAFRVGGRYEFLDSLFGVGANAMAFEVAQGLNILGASSDNDIRLSRPAGDPTFTKVNAEVQRLQRLTSSVNLLIAGRGQLANDALLSSEEFGVGGINSGRGFDPSEIVGDDGVSGKLELQWNDPYRVGIFQDYQVYGFYDIGKVWNKDATTSDDKTNSLASAGLGVRVDFPSEVKAGLAVAVPLTRDVQTQRDDDPRLYMNVSKNF